MANVLGTLFTNIADAIRGKTGETDAIKPADFPKKISSLSVSPDTDAINSLLNQINGEIIGEKLYTVTFIYGNLSYQKDVYEGHDCPEPVSSGYILTPTKESTKYANYIFSGWSLVDGSAADPNVLTKVENNLTVYAAFREELIYISQGTCGDTAYWKMNPDYVITIYGTGAMANYNTGGTMENRPWSSYVNRITEVIIQSGITRVGARAFEGCSALSRVSFTEGCTTVYFNAFYNCQMLSSITLPNTMQYMYENAVRNTSIRNITFPYGMRYFELSAIPYEEMESITFSRTDGWRYSSNISAETDYTELTPEEAADSAKVLEIMRGSSYSTVQFWVNPKWKEDTA